MTDDTREAKEPSFSQSLDNKMDELLGGGKDTAEETSSSEQTTDESSNKDVEASGADQTKNASQDTKKEEEAEEIPKEFHKHPKWQKLLTERNEARLAAEELKKQTIPSELKDEVERFRKVTSSEAFIKAEMQDAGFKPEAIDAELSKRGFKVDKPIKNDLEDFLKSVGADKANVPADYLNVLQDVDRFVDFKAQRMLEARLSDKLGPLEQRLGKFESKETTSDLLNKMENIVKEEGMLDFEKEVLPQLNEFVSKNKDAKADRFVEHFVELNHKLALAKAKTLSKHEERDEKRKLLPKGNPGINSRLPNTEVKSFNGSERDFPKHLDEILDAHGLTRGF